jgi:F-type H+-transporting ATPase subunit epsilon
MADKIVLEIVTPDRRVLSLDVDEVVLPSANGSMGVLYGHAPTLCELDVGEVSYRNGQDREYLAVSGGFAEVLRDKVNVLARTTEAANEIDLDRAQQAKAAAEANLKIDDNEAIFNRAEVKLKRALCRINVHTRARN